MFTQILSTQGLRELCPNFSKMAFILILFFFGFGAPLVQGQIIIIVDDDLMQSHTESTTQASQTSQDSKMPTESYEFSQKNIYPNPFDSQLHISITENENLNHLELINEDGQIVWERNVYSIPDKFIISSIDPGVYYLNLSLSDGEFTETVIYQP